MFYISQLYILLYCIKQPVLLTQPALVGYCQLSELRSDICVTIYLLAPGRLKKKTLFIESFQNHINYSYFNLSSHNSSLQNQILLFNFFSYQILIFDFDFVPNFCKNYFLRFFTKFLVLPSTLDAVLLKTHLLHFNFLPFCSNL